ncbi:putative glycoside hydrolase [Candidatus Nomurabacteria bacterium]|nr:putative glycoside hydrolase [Candidatus Nomurabacteria bacterium]
MSFKINKKVWMIGTLAIIFCAGIFYKVWPQIIFNDIQYASPSETIPEIDTDEEKSTLLDKLFSSKDTEVKPVESTVVASHIETPSAVKAVYISSWVAGSPSFRDAIIKLIDETELNAVVIDIKDSTGRISFGVDDLLVSRYGSSENRIANIHALVEMLHKKNIYIIGRISVFQDPYMTKIKPEWAITKKSDGTVWKDRKGLSFLDPANKNVHDYIIALAHESYRYGFDEINFDYIRYPSDGNLKDINYHLVDGKTRADNIESFFKYLNKEMKKNNNIPMSAVVFGLTTEVSDDMGIGQVWEKAFPYFDYLSPMIYPSHYPPGHAGFKNPAAYPYEVIKRALEGAIIKTNAIGGDIQKIRPWLQDFDMGATYTKELVRAQIKATYDVKLTSWMLWDPRNKYTREALLLETNP